MMNQFFIGAVKLSAFGSLAGLVARFSTTEIAFLAFVGFCSRFFIDNSWREVFIDKIVASHRSVRTSFIRQTTSGLLVVAPIIAVLLAATVLIGSSDVRTHSDAIPVVRALIVIFGVVVSVVMIDFFSQSADR